MVRICPAGDVCASLFLWLVPTARLSSPLLVQKPVMVGQDAKMYPFRLPATANSALLALLRRRGEEVETLAAEVSRLQEANGELQRYRAECDQLREQVRRCPQPPIGCCCSPPSEISLPPQRVAIRLRPQISELKEELKGARQVHRGVDWGGSPSPCATSLYCFITAAVFLYPPLVYRPWCLALLFYPPPPGLPPLAGGATRRSIGDERTSV